MLSSVAVATALLCAACGGGADPGAVATPAPDDGGAADPSVPTLSTQGSAAPESMGDDVCGAVASFVSSDSSTEGGPELQAVPSRWERVDRYPGEIPGLEAPDGASRDNVPPVNFDLGGAFLQLWSYGFVEGQPPWFHGVHGEDGALLSTLDEYAGEVFSRDDGLMILNQGGDGGISVARLDATSGVEILRQLEFSAPPVDSSVYMQPWGDLITATWDFSVDGYNRDTIQVYAENLDRVGTISNVSLATRRADFAVGFDQLTGLPVLVTTEPVQSIPLGERRSDFDYEHLRGGDFSFSADDTLFAIAFGDDVDETEVYSSADGSRVGTCSPAGESLEPAVQMPTSEPPAGDAEASGPLIPDPLDLESLPVPDVLASGSPDERRVADELRRRVASHDPCAAGLLHGYLLPTTALFSLAGQVPTDLMAYYAAMAQIAEPDLATEIREAALANSSGVLVLLEQVGAVDWVAAIEGDAAALQRINAAVEQATGDIPSDTAEVLAAYYLSDCLELVRLMGLEGLFSR